MLQLYFLILIQSLCTIIFIVLCGFDAFIVLNLIQECMQSETVDGALQVLQLSTEINHLKYLMLTEVLLCLAG